MSQVPGLAASLYDGYHQLCKTIEPELGATLQDWDAASNLAWRSGGTGLTSNTCDRGSVSAAQQISFGYDARNRLASTSYGDGSPGITRTYWPDGLPYQTSSNGSTWTYGYSNRRMPTSETLSYGGTNYAIARGYDANGSLTQLSYPDGTVVTYAPDALGRPAQVGAFATGITYWPNGAVLAYNFGNGVAHSVTLNLRGLPWAMTDIGKVSDQYAYDANGNVTAISDLQEGLTSRSMSYDGLNRLKTANGSTWGTGSFAYDVQDNLRSSTVGARSATHGYDANNRLSSVSGSGVNLSYGYDANGNINSRSGQAYVFDLGNRMSSAPGKSGFAYDGEGRRVFIGNNDGTSQVQVYDHAGQLLYATNIGGTPSATKYVYLGGKLIAEVDTAAGTTYEHTDALGSPVARSNGSGALISRTRFEPYGNVAAGYNPVRPDSIGFTGHVNDANTGLTYMQQRYYDPVAGRFLSVDPVVTDGNSGSGFNRYAYGNNSPFRYVDPDGRSPLSCDGLVNCSMLAVSETSNAVDKLAFGGNAQRSSQSFAAGDYGDSLLYFGSGLLFGAANIVSLGGTGALTAAFGVVKFGAPGITAAKGAGSEIGTIFTRVTRNETRLGGVAGEPGVKIVNKDGSIFDMTRTRVKETELNPYVPGGTRPVKYENALNTQGTKRAPTQAELNWFDSISWYGLP